MMKKGMDIQFNWIYVIVVGAVLIIVGISIIGGIKKNANLALVSDVKMYVDNSFRNIQLNHNAQSEINLPDVEIEVLCDTFTVSRKDASGLPLTDIILFSPELLKDRILGYSLSFQMPYETEYFSYITSPGVEYVFEDSELGKQLYDLFPNNLNKGFEKDEKEKNYHTRFIEFEDTFDEQDVLKITVMDDQENFPDSFGKISFGDEEAYFLNKETLIGALYSEDFEKYDCNMKKALNKLEIISNMKKDKLEEFAGKYNNCPYGKAIMYLTEMMNAAKEEKTDVISMKRIFLLSKSIKKENMLLQRLSCPMIY
jgi:hypothetical protein